VGDLPAWKCQSDQAIIDLFRHYGGGQAGGKNALKELLTREENSIGQGLIGAWLQVHFGGHVKCHLVAIGAKRTWPETGRIMHPAPLPVLRGQRHPLPGSSVTTAAVPISSLPA
jgi:hypothetical protein